MINNQFQLGGVTFGEDCAVDIASDGWRPGAGEQRNSSTPYPTRSGVRFGRDLRGSALWEWTLFSNLDEEGAAWDALSTLRAAWDADDVRDVAGDVVPLRYKIADQTRVVYGRPRRWTTAVDNRRLTGNVGVVCDFELVEDTVYDDDVQSVDITLGLPFDPEAGITLPALLPFTFAGGAVQRQSSVSIGGDKPTPVWVTFYGPLTDALVQIGDWKAGLVDPVGGDDSDAVTIDGRPWVAAATRADGAGVKVNPRVTRIHKMWLPPGDHEVIFTGGDPTSSARVKVSWRNARRNPR